MNPTLTTQDGVQGIQSGNQWTNLNYASPELKSSVITPDNLTPTAPATVPSVDTTKTSTVANGVLASAAVTPNPYQSLIDQQNQKVSSTGTDKTATSGIIQSLMNQIGGESARSANLQQEAGLPQKVQDYTKLGNDITSIKLATEKQIQDIKNGSLGPVSAEAANAKIAEITRNAAYDTAVKQISQGLLSNDITYLQNSIKNQLDIEFTPLKAQLDTQKFIYDDQKANFTTAEQRQFELQYNAQKEAIAQQESNRKAVGDLMIKLSENGINVPANVATQLAIAKTPQDAISLLARNGINLQKKSTSSGYYTEASTPKTLKDEIISNIKAGADASAVYSAYPDVETSYLDKLIANINPETSPSKTDTTVKNQSSWWNPFSW
jgi:hypothetical protein